MRLFGAPKVQPESGPQQSDEAAELGEPIETSVTTTSRQGTGTARSSHPQRPLAVTHIKDQERAEHLILGIKYAQIWKEKVFPNGVASDLHWRDQQECPVRVIVRRHGRGMADLVQGWSLPFLEEGCQLFDGLNVSMGELHKTMPEDMNYLRGDMQDWGSTLKDYITIVPRGPCRIFLLLPSLMSEPPWLRDIFAKHRDPNMREVTITAQWKAPFMDTVMYVMSGKYEKWSQQKLRVFKSRKVYLANEQLILPGPGLSTIGDTIYALAFCSESAESDDEGEAHHLRHHDSRAAVSLQTGVAMTLALHKWGQEASSTVAAGAEFTDPGQVGQSLEELDYETWFMRFVKSVKRNRVEDVKQLLLAEAWTLRTKEQRAFIGYLPINEKEKLMSDLSANNHHLEMLALLLQRCFVPLSYKGLKFLVHYWEDVPRAYGTAQSLLLAYLLNHRKPLACCSAILMALRAEIRQRNKRLPTAQLEQAVANFHQLQMLMLEELEDAIHRKAQKRMASMDQHKAMSLTDELDPKVPSPLELSDFRPLRVAFEDRDSAFMAVPLVEGFMVQTWLGEDFIAERCRDGSNSTSYLDPSVLFQLLCGQGLAGSRSMMDHTLELSCRLWHLYMFTGTAFFRSSRGQWGMRLLCSLIYLYVFLQVVSATYVPDLKFSTLANVLVFDIFVVGNVLEVVEYTIVRYRSDAGKYLRRHPITALYLVVDLVMLAVSVAYLCHVYEWRVLPQETVVIILEVWGTMSILVYARILGVLIPVFDGLGPLLNTIAAMVGEVVSFAIPWAFITAGFATAFNVVYPNMEGATSDKRGQLTSFPSTMLMLFEAFLGQFDYTIFDAPDNTDSSANTTSSYNASSSFNGTGNAVPAGAATSVPTSLHLFGIMLLTFYLVASGILLANLLIALITYKYRPEEVRAQTAFNLAQIIDMHQFMVERNMLCSPMCLVQLIFAWVPSATRKKIPPYIFWRCGLPPLDGFTNATPNSLTLPAGRDEIPHLMYLLTVQPLIMVATNVAYYLHTPFCAFYFAASGRKKFLAQVKFLIWRTSPEEPAEGPNHSQKSGGSQASFIATSARLDGSSKIIASSGSLIRHSSSHWGRSGSGNSLVHMDESELDHLAGHGHHHESPWARMIKALISIEGLGKLVLGGLGFAACFLLGAFIYVCVDGLFMITLQSLYAWGTSIMVSLGSIGYGFVAKFTSAKKPAASPGTEGAGSEHGAGKGPAAAPGEDAKARRASIDSSTLGPPTEAPAAGRSFRDGTSPRLKFALAAVAREGSSVTDTGPSATAISFQQPGANGAMGKSPRAGAELVEMRVARTSGSKTATFRHSSTVGERSGEAQPSPRPAAGGPPHRIFRWVELTARLREKETALLDREEVEDCIWAVFNRWGLKCPVTGMPLGNDHIRKRHKQGQGMDPQHEQGQEHTHHEQGHAKGHVKHDSFDAGHGGSMHHQPSQNEPGGAGHRSLNHSGSSTAAGGSKNGSVKRHNHRGSVRHRGIVEVGSVDSVQSLAEGGKGAQQPNEHQTGSAAAPGLSRPPVPAPSRFSQPVPYLTLTADARGVQVNEPISAGARHDAAPSNASGPFEQPQGTESAEADAGAANQPIALDPWQSLSLPGLVEALMDEEGLAGAEAEEAGDKRNKQDKQEDSGKEQEGANDMAFEADSTIGGSVRTSAAQHNLDGDNTSGVFAEPSLALPAATAADQAEPTQPRQQLQQQQHGEADTRSSTPLFNLAPLPMAAAISSMAGGSRMGSPATGSRFMWGDGSDLNNMRAVAAISHTPVQPLAEDVLEGVRAQLLQLQAQVAEQHEVAEFRVQEVQASVSRVEAQLGLLLQQVQALAAVVATGVGNGSVVQLEDFRPESAWGTSRQVQQQMQGQAAALGAQASSPPLQSQPQ